MALRPSITLPYEWRFIRLVVPFLLLAGAPVGCGWLADYEKAMEYQQRRIDYLDQQDKAVTDPINWPAKKKETDQEAVAPSEIFFRPLKGVFPNPEKTPEAKIFQRFRAAERTPIFRDVLVCAAKTTAQDQFRKDVLKALGMSNSVAKSKPDLGEETGQRMQFQYYHDEKPGSPYVYFHTDQAMQIAIVYRPAPGAKFQDLKAMEPIIDYSLTTLALGPAASKRMSAWKAAQPEKPTAKITTAPAPPPLKL